MALHLRRVAARQGVAWVRLAFMAYARRPLGLSSLFACLLLLGTLVGGLLPVVGAPLLMLLPPLLSLGYMIATRSVLAGGPAHPGQLIEPLRTGDAARRRSLLLLCALYAVLALAILYVADTLDGGRLLQLQTLLAGAQTEATRAQAEALLNDPQLRDAILVFGIGGTLLSVPFWHAPALVWWGGQGVAQALFSSALACWRTKGAFAMYGLTWLAVVMLFAILAGLLVALLGLPELAAFASLGAGLVFTVVFYVSLYFSFHDTFGDAETTD